MPKIHLALKRRSVGLFLFTRIAVIVMSCVRTTLFHGHTILHIGYVHPITCVADQHSHLIYNVVRWIRYMNLINSGCFLLCLRKPVLQCLLSVKSQTKKAMLNATVHCVPRKGSHQTFCNNFLKNIYLQHSCMREHT